MNASSNLLFAISLGDWILSLRAGDASMDSINTFRKGYKGYRSHCTPRRINREFCQHHWSTSLDPFHCNSVKMPSTLIRYKKAEMNEWKNVKCSARTLGVLMISIAKDDVGRDSVWLGIRYKVFDSRTRTCNCVLCLPNCVLSSTPSVIGWKNEFTTAICRHFL